MRALGIPTEGPVLLVANRSGILPYDGLMISHVVAESLSERRRPRFLVADWLITLPFVQPYLARLGGVRACRENADRLLRTGRSVVAFPEGLKGAQPTGFFIPTPGSNALSTTSGSAGGDQPHNNIQPSSFLNVYIKL